MTTSEFIKLLQEIDPSGEMKIIANCPRFDYPVGFDAPEFGYITDDWEWANDEYEDLEEGEDDDGVEWDNAEKVVMVKVDS